MWGTRKSIQTSPDEAKARTTDIPTTPVYAPPIPPKPPQREYVLSGLRQCPFMTRTQTEETTRIGGVKVKTQTLSFDDCIGERCAAFRITGGFAEGNVFCTCLRLEQSKHDSYLAKKVYSDEQPSIVH